MMTLLQMMLVAEISSPARQIILMTERDRKFER